MVHPGGNADAAFKGCTALTCVRIPDSVTSIADNAFDGCDKLVIVCSENSAARTFADGHGITWIPD